MTLARRVTLLALIILCLLPAVQAKKAKPKPASCSQGTPYRNFPACGTVKDNKHRTLNLLKNRNAAVTSPKKITVEQIPDPATTPQTSPPNNQLSVTDLFARAHPSRTP